MIPATGTWASRLPEFPWDTLIAAKETALAHPDGLVDLSVGTPVDRVAPAIRRALADAADWPGYPATYGTPGLRKAFCAWLDRTHGVSDLAEGAVLPTVGSKELVASLPFQLGLGAGDIVGFPELAYPTYEVGALLAGCSVQRGSTPAHFAEATPKLLWINSPSNPSGAVTSPEQLRHLVTWARSKGVILASDECYIDMGWDVSPISILHREISGGDHTNLLAVHSLSKRSNLAGYRVGFVSGDPSLVKSLLGIRKHMGAIVPGPIQAAAVAALDDDGHVLAQRSRYADRRAVLMEALGEAGFTIDHSEAGLYLWCTRGESSADTVDWLAERGILVAPGTFYGPAGDRHVRVALTATDAKVAAAADRLTR